jgi:hypothetical protein
MFVLGGFFSTDDSEDDNIEDDYMESDLSTVKYTEDGETFVHLSEMPEPKTWKMEVYLLLEDTRRAAFCMKLIRRSGRGVQTC